MQLTIKNITELLYKKTNHLVLIEWRELYSARRERELQSKGLGGKKQVTHPNHLNSMNMYHTTRANQSPESWVKVQKGDY